MKNLFYPFAIALATIAFASCSTQPEEEPVAVTGVTLNITSQTLEIGKELTLTPTVAPENATDKGVTWSSDKPAVATVTNGVVRGIAAGDATITVTTDSGRKTATCAIKVSEKVIDVTGMILSVTEPKTIVKNEEFTLKVTIVPATATDQSLKLDFDDEIISVTADPDDATQYIVKGLAGGQTTIEVETNALDTEGEPFTASLDVTVDVPLTSISVLPTELTIRPGQTIPLQVTFEPTDATNRKFTVNVPKVTADDPRDPGESIQMTVVDHEIDGNLIKLTGVTPESSTSVTITADAKDADGNAITAICIVRVPRMVRHISLNTYEAKVAVDGLLILAHTIEPASASNQIVTWESEDPAIATVNNSGVVTGVTEGVVNITVKTTDGSNQSATCEVTVEPKEIPAEHPFGTISFRSAQTWNAGGLVWSDFVTATNCQDETYSVSITSIPASGIEDADCACRQNAYKSGDSGPRYYDLFSWFALYKYQDVLCPEPWRAPKATDLNDLALGYGASWGAGGPGTTISNWTDTEGKFISLWGGEYGGYIDKDNNLTGQGSMGNIYAAELVNINRGSYIRWQQTPGFSQVAGQNFGTQGVPGFGLRCVKDAE